MHNSEDIIINNGFFIHSGSNEFPSFCVGTIFAFGVVNILGKIVGSIVGSVVGDEVVWIIGGCVGAFAI